jgi:hypothetical protein
VAKKPREQQAVVVEAVARPSDDNEMTLVLFDLTTAVLTPHEEARHRDVAYRMFNTDEDQPMHVDLGPEPALPSAPAWEIEATRNLTCWGHPLAMLGHAVPWLRDQRVRSDPEAMRRFLRRLGVPRERIDALIDVIDTVLSVTVARHGATRAQTYESLRTAFSSVRWNEELDDLEELEGVATLVVQFARRLAVDPASVWPELMPSAPDAFDMQIAPVFDTDLLPGEAFTRAVERMPMFVPPDVIAESGILQTSATLTSSSSSSSSSSSAARTQTVPVILSTSPSSAARTQTVPVILSTSPMLPPAPAPAPAPATSSPAAGSPTAADNRAALANLQTAYPGIATQLRALCGDLCAELDKLRLDAEGKLTGQPSIAALLNFAPS